jgi:hypothetical protein
MKGDPIVLRLGWVPAAVAFLALAATPVVAAERGPAVTVYSQGTGFVREMRRLDLRGGDTLRIADVPAALDFSSVRLVPPGGARILRLAWRNDVDSGDHMLDAARGARVRVISKNDRTIEGTLIAADGSWVVVRADDGSVSTLSRGTIEEVRLMKPPALLSLRPTLEAVLDGGRRVEGEAELSYLTGGLSWSAEHVLVREGESGGTWSASVTVDNNSGRDYANATLKLVAGDFQRSTPPPMPVMRATMAMEKAGAADLAEQSFSEYHLYALDRPATLRDREAQRLTMIEPKAVKVKPRYLYRGDGTTVTAQLEIVNDAAGGPNVPLPAGRVRLYQADASGTLQLSGEARIPHTPVGEKMTLDVGVAFDLVGEKRITEQHRISDREREYSVEIKLRNRKRVPVTIVSEEVVGGDFDVVKKSHEFTKKDANTIQFAIPVAAGAESVLTYTVRTRY